MRRISALTLFVLAVVLCQTQLSARRERTAAVTFYNSDPSDISNRLYEALLVRSDGQGKTIREDALDPLLWPQTEHLLSEPSHRSTIQLLDEFLNTHGEEHIRDPLRRAFLERDLWAVFDWSVLQYVGPDRPRYEKEKRELQSRLAEVLRRIAPSPEEVKGLPNNYALAVSSEAFAKQYDPTDPERPFLPPDLLDPHGPWVAISPSIESDWGVAKEHRSSVSGRSTFLALLNLPGGRKATYDYFQSLWKFPQPYAAADDQAQVSPALPSFPDGTQVALVRRMNVFDTAGNLVTTNLIESVQIRVYHQITRTPAHFLNGSLEETTRNSGQDFYEFRVSRPLLFSAQNGGLRPVGPEEIEFSTFQTKGFDPIESKSDEGQPERSRPPKLKTCVWCHSGGGVKSFNSVKSLLRPNQMQREPENTDYGPIYWNEEAARVWKQNCYDWGLLNGYWNAAHLAH